MKYLILSHGSCMDGVCAAMVARKWARVDSQRRSAEKLGVVEGLTSYLVDSQVDEHIEVQPIFHGAPFDVGRCRDKTVVMTDIALPPIDMVAIANAAARFIWIDHHKTNADLADWLLTNEDAPAMDTVAFDLKRSGAGIAWDALFPGQVRPWLIDYVEDRDLFRFNLPMSREVNCVVQSTEKTPDAYEELMHKDFDQAARDGAAMVSYLNGWVRDVADFSRRIRFLDWDDVPIVTGTYNGMSDLLEELVKRSTTGIALAWLQRADGMFQYSVRTDGRIDASEVAKRFGGGGHARAAGFQSVQLFPWVDQYHARFPYSELVDTLTRAGVKFRTDIDDGMGGRKPVVRGEDQLRIEIADEQDTGQGVTLYFDAKDDGTEKFVCQE